MRSTSSAWPSGTTQGAMRSVFVPLLCVAGADANEANAIEKVNGMMSDLEAESIGEGKEAQKTYDEFPEWCEDRPKDLKFEINIGKTNKADLEATIQMKTAHGDALTVSIEDLPADIADDEADLKQELSGAEEPLVEDAVPVLKKQAHDCKWASPIQLKAHGEQVQLAAH